MKAKIIIFTALFALLFAGCNEFNDEFEYTAAGVMGGQWFCVCEQYPGYGFEFATTNNNANEAGKLQINDLGTFWDFIVDVDCDLSALTFSAPNGVPNKFTSIVDNAVVPYDITVRVTNGKITRNDLTLPSKSVVDVIEFTVAFEDDTTPYTEYNFKGYRLSGFEEDVNFDPEFF